MMAGSKLMFRLANGNPGALSVVMQLDYVHLEELERMGINKSMIWVGFKDICKENISEFKYKILDGTIEKLVKATPDYKYLAKEGRL